MRLRITHYASYWNVYLLFIEFTRVPTQGCTASSEQDQHGSCSRALDGNMKTDFATDGEGVGAWIEVSEFTQGHIIIVRINLGSK